MNTHYHFDAITNILSLKGTAQVHRGKHFQELAAKETFE